MNKYEFNIDRNNKNLTHNIILEQIKPNSSVLEFGCASGSMTKILKEEFNCDVFIIEIVSEYYKSALKYAKDGMLTNIMEMEWIEKLKGHRFDYIIFADVLEHLYNPKLVLQEAAKLLEYDGRILISVPNIAHSSIILELLSNRFMYQEMGLLDKTHIRFFSYYSLCQMLQELNFNIVKKSACIMNPEETEFKTSIEDLDLQRILNDRKLSNIYQFIFTVAKTNGNSEELLCIEDDIYRMNIAKIDAEIYLDLGQGFDSGHCIRVSSLSQDGDKFFININLEGYKNIKKIRFYPCWFYCKIDNLNVESNFGTLKFLPVNSEFTMGSFSIFLDQRPCYDVYLNENQKPDFLNIQLTCTRITLCDIKGINANYTQATLTYISELQNQYNNQIEKDKRQIQQHKAQIEQYKNQIEQYKNQIEQYKNQIEQYKNQIEQQKTQIEQYSEQMLYTEERLILREKELENIRRNKVYQILANVYKYFKRKTNSVESHSKYAKSENRTRSPLVSIIVPVYNNVPYLKQCIDSAVSQTYENIEVILVDDCSTDNRVKDILNEYESYTNVFLYRNVKNCGISLTTNNAIKYAKGEWLAFLDCDDWLTPEAIEKMMNLLLNKNGAGFGYSNRFNYNNETGEAEEIDFNCRPTQNYYENLQLGMYTSHLKVIHKSVFARIGLFEAKYLGTQDYDFSLKAAFYLGDDIFAYLREPVYYHRIHSTQTTQMTNDIMLEQTELLRKIATKRAAISSGRYNKKISIIVISFNKKEQTLECIESIRNTLNIPYEIILLDNNSSEETKALIRDKIECLDRVRVIYSNCNLGPAKGRLEAAKYAVGDYFVFLDNDIVVSENWINELIIRIENYENVAAVSCKVVFPDDTVQFNSLKSFIKGDFITFFLSGHRKNKDDMQTCDYEENDWIPAGATLYKAEIFRNLEGLELYPNTYEDNEAGYQLIKKGYKLLNCPASIVLHNHYIFLEEKKVEKDYLKARYDEENLIKSSLTFYRRNGLIIRDEFILDKMGLKGKSDIEIKKVFDYRLKNISEKVNKSEEYV